MRVLHICNDYYNTKIYRNLHSNLLLHKMESYMLVPSNYKDTFKDEEVNVVYDKCFNTYDRFFFFIKQNKIFKAIKRQIKRSKPDILHAHFLFTNGYASMKIKEKYGIPYIVAIRNTDLNVFFKYMFFLRSSGIKIILNADRIIFINPSYKKIILSKYVPQKYKDEVINKSIVIPNGIDDFWFENLGFPKKEPKDSNLRLLQVGDINKNKNIEITIKAIDILISKGYKIKFDVVGKIKNQEVFNKIKNLDYINYLGYKSQEELINIYRKNDIFILPSINETFGLVYAEAMSQGLPIIYTKGQGFDGQFKDGEVGYRVNCFDQKDITEKIIKIICNYNKLSTNALNKVDKFKWSRIKNDYISIYEEITS